MTVSKLDPALNELSSAVIGAAIEVHKTLGPGYLEAVYEKSLAIEPELRGVNFVKQPPINLIYKGHNVGEGYLDLLVDNRLIVELKAVETLLPIHKAQVISYLKATGHSLGLLINFNVPVLTQGVRRVILTD